MRCCDKLRIPGLQIDRRFWAKNEGYFVLRLVKMAL
jgi:hypothetical protein